MTTRKLIPDNPTDVFLVKGYNKKDPDFCETLDNKLNKSFKEEYRGISQKRNVIEVFFQKEKAVLLKNIETGLIYVSDNGVLIGTDGNPLREDGLFSLISKKIDAFLVRGYYDNTPGIGNALGERLCTYYYGNYYRVFQVKLEDADEIFQMTAKALLINIRIRRIFVNDNNEIIGVNNKPLSSALTTYFMGIAKNMYHELMRIRGVGTDYDPETIQFISREPWTGMSIPYEQYEKDEGEEHGRWYWYINGESTGIEVERNTLDNKQTITKVPYIGDDLHWWIGSGGNMKDLGALYNELLYDDREITTLTVVVRNLIQMTCICKQVLTLSLYYGKSNDEIMQLMPNFTNKNVLKTRKHKCLEELRKAVNF